MRQYSNLFMERFSMTAGVISLTFHSTATMLFAAAPLLNPGPNEIELAEGVSIGGAALSIIFMQLFLFGKLTQITRFGFLLTGSTAFFTMLAFLVLVDNAPAEIRAVFAFYLLTGAVGGWSWHILHGGDSGRRRY